MPPLLEKTVKHEMAAIPGLLQDAISSTLLCPETLSRLAAQLAKVNSPTSSNVVGTSSMQEKVEVNEDPASNELSRLLSECKYEEAFITSLQGGDMSLISWLCSKVLHEILCMDPVPLSQSVLLSLVKRLSFDLNDDTSSQKLDWITHLSILIDIKDPTIGFYIRPIFEQLQHILNHQSHSMSGPQLLSIRLLQRLIHSILM